MLVWLSFFQAKKQVARIRRTGIMWHMGYGDMDDGVFENQARSRSRKRPRSFGGGSGGAPSSGLGVWLVTVGLCAVFTATTLPTGVFACTSQGKHNNCRAQAMVLSYPVC